MAELTVPQLDFSILGNLGKTYKDARDEAQTRQTLANLGQDIQSGTVDYSKAAGRALQGGNATLGMSLLQLGEAQKKQARATQASQEFMRGLGGMSPTAPPASNAPATAPGPQSSSGNYGDAIASIESGGRYDLMGPVTKTGDRAHGKYQVMGANIGPWTKEALGKEMTPQEFLASPEAQDAVFKAKFGSYAQKYGPEGAAKAWFAGEGGMNNPNARDQLGTTVSAYADKFNRALGPQGVQVASRGGVPTPDTLPANAAPTEGQIAPQQTAQAAPVATPQPQGASITPRMQQLFGAMANPDLPPGQKDIAKMLLQKEFDANKTPEPVQKYLYAKGQGFQGTYLDFETQLRAAGKTTVNVDTKGESKFEEEFGKKQADRWSKYIDNADAAERKMVDITKMREISRRMATVPGAQGSAAGVRGFLGPFAEAVGINIDGVPDIQAFDSVIERLAPQQRAVGSGSTSDVEFKGMKKSLPGLMQNPIAREMTLDTMEALARDDMSRGEIASRLSTGEIKRQQAERELRALPDPMKGFVEWRKANPDAYAAALKADTAMRQAAPKAASAQAVQKAASKPPPALGAIEDGHRFLGGNPADPASWAKVQ